MEFLIESRSSGNQYIVRVFHEDTKPVLTCTCPAGENGTLCKHRIALIDGDFGEVVRSTHDPLEITGALEGSELLNAIAAMRDQESSIKSAQQELKRIKKGVGRLMNGRRPAAYVPKLPIDLPTEQTNSGTKPDTIEGLTVAFTGTLQNMNRSEAKTVAEKHGAKVSGVISPNVDYLVAGDGAGSKRAKAEQQGIKVITETEFLAIIE